MLLGFIYASIQAVLITLLILAARFGPWAEAAWRLGNGTNLKWRSTLFSIRTATDCTVQASEPEFHAVCMTVFKALDGSFAAVNNFVANLPGGLPEDMPEEYVNVAAVYQKLDLPIRGLRIGAKLNFVVHICGVAFLLIALFCTLYRMRRKQREKSKSRLHTIHLASMAVGIMALVTVVTMYGIFYLGTLTRLFSLVDPIPMNSDPDIPFIEQMSFITRPAYMFYCAMTLAVLYVVVILLAMKDVFQQRKVIEPNLSQTSGLANPSGPSQRLDPGLLP